MATEKIKGISIPQGYLMQQTFESIIIQEADGAKDIPDFAKFITDVTVDFHVSGVTILRYNLNGVKWKQTLINVAISVIENDDVGI